MSTTDKTRTPEAKRDSVARRDARTRKYVVRELDLESILAELSKADAR